MATLIKSQCSLPPKVARATRCYFVLKGQGIFVIDGETFVVERHNHITVFAGQTYSYEGDLELFGYGVSPDNVLDDETP